MGRAYLEAARSPNGVLRRLLKAARRWSAVAEAGWPGADLCLGGLALLLWFLLDCLQLQLFASRQELRLVAEVSQWQPGWPTIPWLLGLVGLLLVFLSQARGWLAEPRAQQQRLRLRQVLLLGLPLLLLRLGSLWDPVCYLFPWLTLLWSPHAAWALGLAFLLFPLLHALPSLPWLSTRAIALALFSGGALVYGAYTLYFCQMAMLHGDEGQYLRVTQSLLHDGDMDLANNLEQIGEFHVTPFETHKAPASPPGKVHSVHPIGLSALLVPSYWAGLHWWENPRLGCALFMALITALGAALAWVWLVRLGVRRALALGSVLVMATTLPFFLYCNQLFPEMPALLILFAALALLAHWQTPGAAYRSLGRWEPALLGGITALLVCLLFLHPRYLPLAALLGVGMGLQAWHSPRKPLTLRTVGAVALLGGVGLLSFNYAFSGDLFGHFLPGNAWEEGALQPSTWLLSLPGHWLHATAGLVNSSPVFLACLAGWAGLVRRGALKGKEPWDRRLLVMLALYAATAGVNGLHPDWTFGFCLPARFLLTALPALLWGLALALERIAARAAAFFLFLLGLAISWDGLWEVVMMPEVGYAGNFLPLRAIAGYYPWDLPFFSQTRAPFPWSNLLFWVLLITAIGMGVGRWKMGDRNTPISYLLAALLPLLWGQAGFLERRLAEALSPYIYTLSPQGAIPEGIPSIEQPLSEEYRTTTGQRQEDGRLVARAPQDLAGALMAYYTPLLRPGIHRFLLPDLEAAHPPGQVAGYFIVAQRPTVPAMADWGVFHARPLQVHGGAIATDLFFQADEASLGYAYVEFAGAGELSFQRSRSLFYPLRLESRLAELRHYPVQADSGSGIYKGARYENLGRGQYAVRFQLRGTAFSTFFARRPMPVYMAVYVAQDTSQAARDDLNMQAFQWFSTTIPIFSAEPRPDFIRPLVESVQAPWWTAVPLAGRRVYQIDFGLTTARDAWFLLCYEGEAPLILEGITLFRKTSSSPLLPD